MTEIEKQDVIEFGTYNGSPIQWIVLRKNGKEALLLSKYCLFDKPYNEECKSVTWETCSLRNWLNNDFYDDSFTEEEKSRIIESSLINSDNPIYKTEGGNDTEDKVFLLSIDEAEEYFSSSEERAATYANGIWAWWWLRSPGVCDNCAASVYNYGSVSEYGDGVDSDANAIRPALWVNLDSNLF